MKIFLISRGFPTKEDPTWGCFELDQALALSEMGHDVVMLSVDTRTRLRWRKIGISEYHQGNVHALNIFVAPCPPLIVGWKIRQKIATKLLSILYKCAYKKYGQPDVLYSHYLFNSQLAVSIKQKYNIPLVCIEHWSALNIRPIPKWVRTMVKATYPNSDKIVAVSESLKCSIQEHSNLYAIDVVHNMVGADFQYMANGEKHPFTFIATGRLTYGKGFDLLPIAFNKVKDTLPSDWKMIIIGGGEEQQHLQKQIDDAGLKEHIQLVGQKNKSDIVPLLQNSDVFILPSRGENFSVAVLEALACGLPVIASITGGIRECITPQNGILFPVDDADALAEAIKTMYVNCAAYDHCAIADDCQARFSPQVIAHQLTNIFQQVISSR